MNAFALLRDLRRKTRGALIRRNRVMNVSMALRSRRLEEILSASLRDLDLESPRRRLAPLFPMISGLCIR